MTSGSKGELSRDGLDEITGVHEPSMKEHPTF